MSHRILQSSFLSASYSRVVFSKSLESISREENINKRIGNGGFINEIQKKPAICDPTDALHYFCIFYVI